MKYLQIGLTACAVVCAAATSALAQTPTVAGAVNSASYTPAGLPGSAVAPGSIVAIFGTNLGPAQIVHESGYPIPKTLSGTSATITVGGTTLDMPIFYTLSSQVAAIVPSQTPVGTGTITVTYNSQPSASAPITVVPSSVGLYTLASSGTGPAVVTFANYSVIGSANPAHNGDTIVLWGTGLGAITSDDAAGPAPGNLSYPINVYLGGVAASVTYHGRSGCCAGLDQIVIVVPPSVQGCNVSLVIQTGDQISNYSSLAVAPPGQTVCTDPTSPLSGTDTQKLFSGGTFRIGSIVLSQSTTLESLTPGASPTPVTSAFAVGEFEKVTIPAGTISAPTGLTGTVSIGSCTVTTLTGSTTSTGTGPTPISNSVSLDAGPSLLVSGTGGTLTLPKVTSNNSIAYYASLPAASSFLNGGTYTTTGTGGPDIGAFSASVSLPPALIWTNQASITTVNRSAGQLITWSGGDPNGSVIISGESFVESLSGNYTVAIFECLAKTSAGSFTIPPIVTLSLPPSGSIEGISLPGSLSLESQSAFQSFTAPGLDLGFIETLQSSGSSVVYQ